MIQRQYKFITHYKNILNLSFPILQSFILFKFMIEIQTFNGSFK